jgi:hypothetical protein
LFNELVPKITTCHFSFYCSLMASPPEVIIATGALACCKHPPVNRRQLHVLLSQLLRALGSRVPHLLNQRLVLLLLLLLFR